MTLRTTIKVTDHFNVIDDLLERRVIDAVNHAAAEGAREAERVANTPTPIAHFTVLPARNIGTGFAAGVKAGPLARIFDKGSLGKHEGRLKRGRKPSWQVNRGANPFTAQRHEDLEGKGVAPRHIFAQARTAARAALRQRLLSR